MIEFNVHDKAREIAQVLGWVYPEPQDGWTARIEKPDLGAQLWIANDRGRCRISGGFEKLYVFLTYERRDNGNQISVNPLKPIEQIVRDIRKRLLPTYLDNLGYVQQRFADHQKRMKEVADTVRHFAAILDVPPPEVSEQEICSIRVGYHTNIWGEIVVGNKDVDLRITDVPFELAAVMLVPLGDYLKRHKKEQTEDAD